MVSAASVREHLRCGCLQLGRGRDCSTTGSFTKEVCRHAFKKGGQHSWFQGAARARTHGEVEPELEVSGGPEAAYRSHPLWTSIFKSGQFGFVWRRGAGTSTLVKSEPFFGLRRQARSLSNPPAFSSVVTLRLPSDAFSKEGPRAPASTSNCRSSWDSC